MRKARRELNSQPMRPGRRSSGPVSGRRRLWRAVLPALLWAGWCTPVAAVALELPLSIPYALLERVGQGPAGQAGPVVLGDGPCRRLQIAYSRLEPRDGELHLVSGVSAAFGVPLLGRCIEPIDWRGTVDAHVQPYIDAGWQLRFRLGDAELRDADGGRAPLMNLVWDLSERFVNRRVAALHLDLQAPRTQLGELLAAVADPQTAAALGDAVRDIQPGPVSVDEYGIRVVVRLALPDAVIAALAPPPPAHAPPQVASAQSLELLDAFVVEAVKRLADLAPDTVLHQQLVDLLLDSRHDLVGILQTPRPHAVDPVRQLFAEDWRRLQQIVTAAIARGANDSQLLRYAAFLNAGDLLLALDRGLPQAGAWFSAAGLREALRALSPYTPVPALEYDRAVDPALRALFGLPPEPPPGPDELGPPRALPEDPDVDDEALRGAGLPGLAGRLLRALVGEAAAAQVRSERVLELQRRIGRRVPARHELGPYAAAVAELLGELGREEVERDPARAGHADLFDGLLPAVAMIESCWRQFRTADGATTYVVSSAGAVGMLQINQRVWRGLYDVERLRWEVAYNARAGAQILWRYLEGPAAAVVERTGQAEHLARAAYAAYNGGPKAAGRFLGKDGTLRPGPVDRKLWRLYQGFSRGGVADLTGCTVMAEASAGDTGSRDPGAPSSVPRGQGGAGP